MTTIRTIAPAEYDSARELLRSNGRGRRVGNADDFAQLLARSPLALVAVEEGRVAGLLRAWTNGCLSMVVVAASHRRRGIGRALASAAMGHDKSMTWVLRAGRDGGAGFCEKLGFVRSQVAMERAGARATTRTEEPRA